MTCRNLLPASIALAWLVSGAAAQIRLRVDAPVGAIGVDRQGVGGLSDDEVGVPVELFENPNLDRYLRKAQDFLGREDFVGAIRVLQDVIEGRTIEAVDSHVTATGEEGPGNPAGPDGTNPDKEAPPPRLADPSQAVFSADGRLFRPVRRLCHELLATMPRAGLDLYRTSHEVTAERMLADALQRGSLQDLEQVGNRYFVTLAAGRAMREAADRLMHLGRNRAAVQVLRDLLELYPEDLRRQLGIENVWLRFKIALAMRMAGEHGAARDAVERLAADFPRETLRVMGELQAVKDLPRSPLFVGDEELLRSPTAGSSGLDWMQSAETLVPLWQLRYEEREPYRGNRTRNQNEGFVVFGEGGVRNVAPSATKHGTGTNLAFLGEGMPAPSVVFYDNFRLRRCDAFTGLLTHEGDGRLDMQRPRDNHPRVRIPAIDHALMRPVEDEARYYAVLGYDGSNTSSLDVLRSNDLVAYRKDTMARVWSSADWREGDDGLRDVTFLAAPVVFGERLLASVKRRDAYSLQCLDRSTGRPLWCTRLHAGGTVFFKAPGSAVRVQGGVAYLLTNAGGLAAVDAFSGDLKWIRRYERRHPLRSHRRSPLNKTQQQNFYGVQFQEEDLPTFLASDIVVAEGLVIFAPCDGEVLMCLDGASGEPVWMIDGGPQFTPHQRLQSIVGANSRHLYAASEDALVCIGLRSGVRLWHASLPSSDQLSKWRGRGLVTEDFVLMPGAREVLLFPAGGGEGRRMLLPTFSIGDEPLSGDNNLFLSGPWLGVAYQGGLEVYSAAEALRRLATGETDPLRKAGYLHHADGTGGAIEVLAGWLDRAPEGEGTTAVAMRLLELCQEQSRALAAAGKREQALTTLSRARQHARDRTVRLNWHLARMELFQQLQDLKAFEAEQQSLYRYIEGKDK